jgi:hypothetical protein
MQFKDTFRILAVITCTAMLSACVKEDKCRDGFVPKVTVNSPTLGDTLRLSVEEVDGAYTTYRWHGPNRFVSTEREPVIRQATALNAGRYTVDVITESGCIYTATTDSVVVKDAQDVSCNLAVNTIAMDDAYSFYDVDGVMIDDLYYMTGNAAGAYVTMKFNNGGNGLTPGVYTTAPLNTSFGQGYVSVRFNWWNAGTDWMADSGNKVYVSISGGKISVTFCNMSFHTMDGQTAGKGSLYLVYP